MQQLCVTLSNASAWSWMEILVFPCAKQILWISQECSKFFLNISCWVSGKKEVSGLSYSYFSWNCKSFVQQLHQGTGPHLQVFFWGEGKSNYVLMDERNIFFICIISSWSSLTGVGMKCMGKVCHNSKGSPSGSVFIKFNTNYISYGVIFLSKDNLSESDRLFISARL